jgi:hypothetical protein
MPVVSAMLFAAIFAAERPPEVLPLRKLRLYETGVGYFERHGAVGAGKKLALPLPGAHLDDALKSLVVLEGSGTVRVQGVEFASAVSEEMARTLAGLPSGAGTPVRYVDLLQGLEGAEVEVRTSAARIRGRLVDVEGPFEAPLAKDERLDPSKPREPYYTLLVLDSDDAVRRISTKDVTAVKAMEKGTASRLEVVAESVSAQRSRRQKRLEVQVARRGQLGLGYIAESPVWRTTYRVVLGRARAQGQLQAWALVHNDTDEDWRKVQVEFANGRPRSFLHSLAVPRYAYRDVLEVEDGLSTVPQTDTDVYGALTGDTIGESFGVGGLGLVGTGRGGGGKGEGTIGLGSVGLIGEGDLGDLAELSKAESFESGAQFIYRAAEPIDLDAHHSALVPLVQDDVEVESITMFERDGSTAFSGVRLVNTTGRTLPAGVASFFGDGGFVGEAVLDRLKAKERRFIRYGMELDVELTKESHAEGETTKGVRFLSGAIEESYFERSRIGLTIENKSSRSQKVYVTLDVPRRADLTADAGVELDFDLSENEAMAAVEVPQQSTAKKSLEAKTARLRKIEAHDAKGIAALIERKGLPQGQRKTLGGALRLLEAAEAAEGQAAELVVELARIEQDLARQRKNLAAVGKADAARRLHSKLTKELLELEEKLKRLRDARDQLAQKAETSRRKATAQLKQL